MSKGIGKHNEDTKATDETPLQGFAAICSTLVIGLFVLTFVFQNFVIPSASMASTLLIGYGLVEDNGFSSMERSVWHERCPGC